MSDPAEFPFVYIHEKCGKPAFYLTEMPAAYSYVRAKIVRTLSGGRVVFGEIIRCGSCGEGISPLRTTAIR